MDAAAYNMQAAVPNSLLSAVQVEHLCDWRCSVQHEFGNLYKCLGSGLQHVCDANCNMRIYNDAHSSICRVSRKVFPPLEDGMDTSAPKKRDSGLGHTGSFKQRRTLSNGGAAPEFIAS